MGEIWTSAALRRRSQHQSAQPSFGLRPKRLGETLLQGQAISGDHLMRALVLQQHQRASLGDILVSEGWAERSTVLMALAQQYQMQTVNLSGRPLSKRLLERKPVDFWLGHCIAPWMQLGSTVIFAIAHPEQRTHLRQLLAPSFGEIRFVLTDEDAIRTGVARHMQHSLVHRAVTKTPNAYSCRDLMSPRRCRMVCLLLISAVLAFALAPKTVFLGLTALAMLSLILFTSLRLSGLIYALGKRGEPAASRTGPTPRKLKRLPRLSVLVPLYKEADISRDLLRRLGKLSYPRSLLEIFLVLEEHDAVTRAAVQAVTLPDWIKVIEVPASGTLKTKPRAMNYALEFCRGDLVGVWDAEDAPQGNQLEQVAKAFASADKNVACFQGVLDYYNPTANWLARCFTLEYASWFRLILPAMSRLGLVLPLGGTTMFIRRSVLQEVGGWDAHNVTEDADLGVRLYRAGYETRMLPATTYEEANCRIWPWVKQRSRWLKGFMITYLVHMQRPGRLVQDLGWRKFFGFQFFFIGAVGQFLFAPVLWTYWIVWFGSPHPITTALGPSVLSLFFAVMVACELTSICIATAAAFVIKRPSLALCAPTLLFYFPLGTIAAYKALRELLNRPFFWDKTRHGFHSDLPSPPTPRALSDPQPHAAIGSQTPLKYDL